MSRALNNSNILQKKIKQSQTELPRHGLGLPPPRPLLLCKQSYLDTPEGQVWSSETRQGLPSLGAEDWEGGFSKAVPTFFDQNPSPDSCC